MPDYALILQTVLWPQLWLIVINKKHSGFTKTYSCYYHRHTFYVFARFDCLIQTKVAVDTYMHKLLCTCPMIELWIQLLPQTGLHARRPQWHLAFYNLYIVGQWTLKLQTNLFHDVLAAELQHGVEGVAYHLSLNDSKRSWPTRWWQRFTVKSKSKSTNLAKLQF